MALTYAVTYEMEDDSGDVATFDIPIPTTFALADYAEFGRGMATFVDALTSGIVRSASLGINVDLSSLTGNVVGAGSDVEEIASFQYLTLAGRKVNVNVPGADETDVLPNSDDLDVVGDVNIAAFNNAMLNGVAVTAGTIIPCDVAEEDLSSLNYAREAFRATGVRR